MFYTKDHKASTLDFKFYPLCALPLQASKFRERAQKHRRKPKRAESRDERESKRSSEASH